MVAERYGTAHHEETVVPSLTANLPDLVYFLDEPSDPLSVCTYLRERGWRARHVKVVLGGDGGDELFGGYDRYYGNLYAGYYALLPPAVRRGVISPLLGLIPDGGWYKSKSHQVKWLHRASFLTGGERYAADAGLLLLRRPSAATGSTGRSCAAPPPPSTPTRRSPRPTSGRRPTTRSTACSTPTARSGCPTTR